MTSPARAWPFCWVRCRGSSSASNEIEILIVGRGDEDELRESAGTLAGHLRFLGQVDDAEKASALRSADVYCAPNTGGESFGIVLVEAMAAGTAVVASDLDAFRRVLVDGTAGRLVPVDDPEGLADGLIEVLENDVARERFIDAAADAVHRYDWSVVAGQIMRVYETVAGAGAKVQVAGTAGWGSAQQGRALGALPTPAGGPPAEGQGDDRGI